jgi:hypothetical protein
MSEKRVGAQVRVDLAGFDTGDGRIGAGMSVGGTITQIEGSQITVRLRAPVAGQDTVTVTEANVSVVVARHRS